VTDPRAIYAGHFGPESSIVPNAPKICVVVTRDPMERTVSHYSFFKLDELFGGRSFGNLTVAEARRATNAVGGTRYMTEFLTCPGYRCGSLHAAKGLLERCIVGTQERFNEFLMYLSLVQPWLGAYSSMSKHHYAHSGHESSSALPPSISDALKPSLGADLYLHLHAQRVLHSQLADLQACFKSSSVSGRETTKTTSRSTTIQDIVNYMQSAPLKDQNMLASCLISKIQSRRQ